MGPIDIRSDGAIAAEQAWPLVSADTGSEFDFWSSSDPASETTRFLQGTADFVINDGPLPDEKLVQAKGKILHFPTIVGGDAIIYNLPELAASTPLRLTGPILADIYLGKIKQWNIPIIQAANLRINLKTRDIVCMCLPAASGGSSILADYLSKVSPSWRGHFQLSSWSSCTASQSDAEEIENVRRTPGSIGYAEIGVSLNLVPTAAMLNRDGSSVEPNAQTLEAAAVESVPELPSDLRMSITNAAGGNSYPIASYSYLLLYEHQPSRRTGEAIIRFLSWVLQDGQKYAAQFHYAPLPAPLVRKEQEQLRQVSLPPLE